MFGGGSSISSSSRPWPGVLLALALLAAACSRASPAAPTATPTAADFVAVRFPSADGRATLGGRLYGGGSRSVVLAHMRPADQRLWEPFARELARQGYLVLTFDFRGYPASPGPKDDGKVADDLSGALAFLRGRGVERPALVGASMGATASLAVAADQRVAGVVAISAPPNFAGVDAAAAAPRIGVPVLFLAATADDGYLAAARRMAATARDADVLSYEGDEHGQDLVNGDHAREVRAAIEAFLRQVLG